MIDHRSPPPEAEACLCGRYPSSQKGGTLIAEEVTDLATHERRLLNPDGYRPKRCPECGGRLHGHGSRPRVLAGDPAAPATRVARFRCPIPQGGCGAVFQVLPALLARHLWRSWRVVEAATISGNELSRLGALVPERTRRRWQSRLASAARVLLVVLGTASPLFDAVVGAVGLDATRRQLVEAYSQTIKPRHEQQLSSFAALVHRLAPGVRLM